MNVTPNGPAAGTETTGTPSALSALWTAMEAVLRPLGMDFTHYSCLELLAQRPGLSNAELARGIFVSRQSMNVRLQSLERGGLVSRAEQAPAGRALPTLLAPRGERQVREANAAAKRVEDSMHADLVLKEREQLRGFLGRCVIGFADGKSG